MRPSPLPNRIDPFGVECATRAHGAWTGNRGVIHREHEIVKRATTTGWVICRLEFKNRRRRLMAPGRWTELFFLDEATAFAAGHRPCWFCRREDALRFAARWGDAHGLGRPASAPEIDDVLKSERRHAGCRLATRRARFLAMAPRITPDDLVRGTIISAGDEAYLFDGARFLRWSFEGYRPAPMQSGPLTLLTPPSTLAAFRAGYVPQIDASAEA